jgi:RimJ/RimL family protein N-acetyltransferase
MLQRSTTILRAPEPSDLEFLRGLRNDADLQFLLAARPRANSEQRVRDWLARHLDDPQTLFFIIADASRAPCGYIQLTHIDPIDRHGRLGICLAPAAQGRGHATDALALLEGYARDTFGVRKVVLSVLSTNARAIAFYQANGYLSVGVHKRHVFLKGDFNDLCLMEKLL